MQSDKLMTNILHLQEINLRVNEVWKIVKNAF
jgi:hypothetical protein